MGLSARTISSMKWRTTFVALALLAFFTYGPRLRKEREQNWEQFGENLLGTTCLEFEFIKKCKSGGRHLLQEDGTEAPDYDYGGSCFYFSFSSSFLAFLLCAINMVLKRFCALSIILNIKYNCCKFPPDEAFDTRTGDDAEDVDLPNCDATKSGYDDYVVFKTEMKRYAKASADPGSISMLLCYGNTILEKISSTRSSLASSIIFTTRSLFQLSRQEREFLSISMQIEIKTIFTRIFSLSLD